MNKKLLIIAGLMNIVLGLGADEATDLENLFSKSRPSDLTELASNLSARGSLLHTKGKYQDAIGFYQKSLKIRKELGLENSKSYALILFLNSVAEHRMGNSCKASQQVKEVIKIYQYLGFKDDAKLAEEEGLNNYDKSCRESLVSRN